MNFFASAMLTLFVAAMIDHASSGEDAVTLLEGEAGLPASLSMNSYVSMVIILGFSYEVLRAR